MVFALFVCMHVHVSFLISCSCRLWGLEFMNSVYTPADQCSPCRITDTSGTSPLPLSSRLVSARGQIQQLPDVKSHLHWEKGSVRSLCLQFVPLFPLSPGSCGRCRQWCGFLSASCSSALWLNAFQICLSSFQHNSTNTRFLRLLQTWVPVLSFLRTAFSSWVQPCVWTSESVIFQTELFSGAAL